MRVLVTGAAGFIGSHVARQLVARGDAVTGVVLEGEDLGRVADLSGRLDLIECDLQDRTKVRRIVAETRPEAAVHLAWYTVPGRYREATENLDCVWQGVTLARLLAEHGTRRLVAAGTCAEYDWSCGRLVEDETPCRPRTLYGAAKHALFLLLSRFCRQGPMELAWLRYNYIFGPGEHPRRLVPSVIEKLVSGEDVPCTTGAQRRDFAYVEDVASATVAVLDSGVEGAVNVGSGTVVAVREVIGTLAELIDGPGRPLFGRLRTDPDEPEALVPELGRLNEEVGWRTARSLPDGLRRTLDHWRGAAGPEGGRTAGKG